MKETFRNNYSVVMGGGGGVGEGSGWGFEVIT